MTGALGRGMRQRS